MMEKKLKEAQEKIEEYKKKLEEKDSVLPTVYSGNAFARVESDWGV